MEPGNTVSEAISLEDMERLLHQCGQDLERCVEENKKIRCRENNGVSGVEEIQDRIDEHIKIGPHDSTYLKTQIRVGQRLEIYRRKCLRRNIQNRATKRDIEQVCQLLQHAKRDGGTWNAELEKRCQNLLAKAEEDIRKSGALRDAWENEVLHEDVQTWFLRPLKS